MTTSNTLPAPASAEPIASSGSANPAAGKARARFDLAARYRGQALFAAKLASVLAIAIGLRLWIVAQPGFGHEQDLRLFVRWTQGLTEHGLAGFYDAESFCDYPPLMLLLFRGVGATVAATVGDAAGEHEIRFGIKALACLADLAIGLLLLLEGRRLFGGRGALLACGLYLLNPVALYDSAFWGQMDSIYTALIVAALAFAGRGSWRLAGLAAAASLTAKFQAIAILPLVVFEAYRLGSWCGLRRLLSGASFGLLIVAVPFIATGQLRESVDRAYIRVVGQYHEKSKNAYNLWYLVDDPEAADVSPPSALVSLAAEGHDVVGVNESWLLELTWRRISLVIFALSVAIVLSLYAVRPGPATRYGAAGLLALCFFLFPTEMHERYAYPAVALLAVWAAAHAANERVYWVFTVLLLLNLAAVLPAAPLAPQIAAANLAVFASILVGLLIARTPADERAPRPPLQEGASNARRPILIPVFQIATATAVAGAIGLSTWLYTQSRSMPGTSAQADTVWLSSLDPRSARQGWKTLAHDRSVSGGHLQLGDSIYLRGLGTHAPATLVYDVIPGCDTFEAIAGINNGTRGGGSVILHVELDGVPVYTSPTLTGNSDPLPIRIALDGTSTLTLKVDPAGDGKRSDHLDLALARFTSTSVAGSVPLQITPEKSGAPSEQLVRRGSPD